MSMKLPVPYVFLAMPTSKHAWPKVAACWSPRMPAMGTSGSMPPLRPLPYTSADERISGNIDIGMPMSDAMDSSHDKVLRSIKSVREALVTSVTCTPPFLPPVMFHSTHVSMVPMRRSPASAFSRAPSTFSRIHITLGPAKYVASGRPTVSLYLSMPASPASFSMIFCVRVSCQTMAL